MKLYQQAAQTGESMSNIETIRKKLFGYAAPDSYHQRLRFEPPGIARLCATQGWLLGLHEAGKEELAEKLTGYFQDKIDYLAGYGGDMEIPVDDGKQTVSVPAYKVVLSDDGLFGSFSILWYRAILQETFIEKARSFDEEAYTSDLPADESRKRWDAALDKATEAMRIRKDLEEFPRFTSEHAQQRMNELKEEYGAWYKAPEEKKWACGATVIHVRYGFSFNGGLILHGRQQNFTVRLVNDDNPWSIHT